MKKAVILFVLLISGRIYAESVLYSVPEPVSYGMTNAGAEDFDIVNIYPIGWSRDGKFAYVLWRDYIGTIGRCGDFKFIIRDLVTDAVVWSYDYFEEGSVSFADMWEYNYSRFAGKLRQYAIAEQTFRPEPLPYAEGGDSLSIEIQAVRKAVSGGDYIRSFEVVAISRKRGAKSLYSEPMTILESIEPAYCFRSPFEKRIAVVLIQKIPALDNLGAVVNPVVIGCHLEARFVR